MKTKLLIANYPFIFLLILILTACPSNNGGGNGGSAPKTPSNLTASSGNTKCTLNWNAVANVSSYEVYQSTTPNVSTSGSGIEVTNSTYEVSGLQNGTTYYFVVTASNNNGTSNPSSEVSCIPKSGPPSSPNNLKATAGDQKCTLSWNAVNSTTSYNIHQDIVSPVNISGQGTNVNTNRYIATNLQNGTTYYFVVTASNSNGTSNPSSEVSCIPKSGPPSSPNNLKATAGDQKCTLSWNVIVNASYEVHQSTTPNVNTSGQGTTVNINSYVATNLQNNTTYYFVVTASNSNGTSSPSTEVPCTPKPNTPAPSNLKAIAGDQKCTLEWDSIVNVASYSVYQSTIPNVNRSGQSTAVNTNTYLAENLQNNTTYYFVVTATDNNGTSGPSTEISCTPKPDPPSAPNDLKATANNQKCTLEWTAVANVSSYDVYQSITPNVSTSGSGVETTDSTYEILGLQNGTTYYFVVTASNIDGVSGPSNEVSCTPQIGNPPSAPNNLSVTPNNQVCNLSWDTVNGASFYNVYKSTNTPVDKTDQKEEASTNSHDAKDLDNGTQYYFAATASNQDGESDLSNEISCIPTN